MVMNNNIKKHEDKYFHIPKSIIKGFIKIIAGIFYAFAYSLVGFFWVGILNGVKYSEDATYIFAIIASLLEIIIIYFIIKKYTED